VHQSHFNTLCHELCDKRSAVAEMGDRLATIGMGRKEGGLLCPFRWGELGSHLTQCGLGMPSGILIYPAV